MTSPAKQAAEKIVSWLYDTWPFDEAKASIIVHQVIEAEYKPLVDACKAWIDYMDSDLSEGEAILVAKTQKALEAIDEQT